MLPYPKKILWEINELVKNCVYFLFAFFSLSLCSEEQGFHTAFGGKLLSFSADIEPYG